MPLTFDQISQFITDDLGVEGDSIAPDTPLFSSGLIDSFSLVSLMSFIEAEGGVSIAPTDVTIENFDSVERILAFLARSRAEA
jgi:acyl carrier protein